MVSLEIEKKLIKYLRRLDPELPEDAEIIVKQSKEIDIKNEGVSNLVMMIQTTALSQSQNSVSNLRTFVIILAEYLGEIDAIKTINEVWGGKTYGIPVSRMERTLPTQTAGNKAFSPVKSFRYAGKVYALSELDQNLKECKHKILAEFYALYFRYNIVAPSMWGKLNEKEKTIMPAL
jgi:hypothetical protein